MTGQWVPNSEEALCEYSDYFSALAYTLKIETFGFFEVFVTTLETTLDYSLRDNSLSFHEENLINF